ncbi:hypothetical protein ACIRPT_40415 [Streptomyces sp. NPDC101227]|uniref:hypothetical protein n=1 Tax=Streptomyces sp. NPDC101227 TaxID=3366136 RepID=UPI0038044678
MALLGSALDLLTGLGACAAILCVDDDAPAGDPERDRTAANGMYDRAGITEVDRLHSFTRRPTAPRVSGCPADAMVLAWGDQPLVTAVALFSAPASHHSSAATTRSTAGSVSIASASPRSLRVRSNGEQVPHAGARQGGA